MNAHHHDYAHSATNNNKQFKATLILNSDLILFSKSLSFLYHSFTNHSHNHYRLYCSFQENKTEIVDDTLSSLLGLPVGASDAE